MTLQINRRTLFLGMVSIVISWVARAGGAQSRDIRGGVTYHGGKVIPEGQIEVFLEDPAVQTKTRLGGSQERIESDGKSREVTFSLVWPAGSSPSPNLRIVALLERQDGWLLARGSAQVEVGRPVSVALNTVMY
ncbi:hypothetical protein [Roseobacter sinensis]|uniref:Uncharacterized protein n=1 Tax=Roseobacter sinensis TaxID=2931391 RepID=A0ABT3BKU3_9RHOB|nr:hypothetical protein [Roseobacter sp. WL0113]MCV3274175.1 hypothetical protein [Roseobacter sp. WL0113]